MQKLIYFEVVPGPHYQVNYIKHNINYIKRSIIYQYVFKLALFTTP